VAARSDVTVKVGHDRPDLPQGDDWTSASDHGPFHAAGIPFLYFGVEDHPGYHNPSDDAEHIKPEFYAAVVATIIDAVRELDARVARGEVLK
jgi:Zn-dependent M28 family amino/carboxypeptidase